MTIISSGEAIPFKQSLVQFYQVTASPMEYRLYHVPKAAMKQLPFPFVHDTSPTTFLQREEKCRGIHKMKLVSLLMNLSTGNGLSVLLCEPRTRSGVASGGASNG